MIFELPDCSFTKLKKHATFVLCKRRIGVFGLGDDWKLNFRFYFPRKKYGGVLCGSFSPAPSDGGHPPAVQSFWCVQAGVMACLLYAEGIRP